MIIRNAAFCLFLFCGASGCGRSSSTATNPPATTSPTITIVKPEERSITRTIEQPGSIQANEETVLYSKISGFVQSISLDPSKKDSQREMVVDIGSRIKKDQTLATLYVPELEEEFKQKKAVVRQMEAEVIQASRSRDAAEAALGASKAKVNEAKAGLSREEANFARWELEVVRVEKLVVGGVIDTQTRDETLKQFKSAEAGRNEAIAKVGSAEAAVVKAEADKAKAIADVTASEAKLDVAKADVRRLEALFAYSQIKAPYDGIITKRTISTGDFLTSDGKHGVFHVARIDPVRLVVQVPENESGLIQIGQEMRIQFQAINEQLTAKVARTSWSLDPGSRTLRVEVDLPNPEGKLRPGMYAYTRITVALPKALTIPATAIIKLNDEPVGYLLQNGKANRVMLALGRGDSQSTQVLRYRKPNETNWTEIQGTESFATPATAITDGMELKGKE